MALIRPDLGAARIAGFIKSRPELSKNILAVHIKKGWLEIYYVSGYVPAAAERRFFRSLWEMDSGNPNHVELLDSETWVKI